MTGTVDGLVSERRVHRSAFTDARVFDLEMERVYGGGWVYLTHESQLPGPRDYVTAWLGRRPVLVTRARDGSLHGLVNRCRHRGVTLTTADCGTAGSFRCEYHGWTYRNTGELTGVPYPKGYGPAFDKSRLGLLRLSVASVGGFVFGTLNADPEPLVDHLGPAIDALAEWTDRAPGGRLLARNGSRQITVEANWKVVWDNSADGYHPAFTHKSLMEVADRHREGLSLSHFDGDPDDLPMHTTDLGRGNAFLDQRPSVQGGAWAHARPVPGVEQAVARLTARYGDDARRWLDLAPPGGMNISVFPNLLVNGNFVTTLQPIDVGHAVMHERPVTFADVPDEVNWLRLRFCEDFVNFGEPDDIEMWERAQRGYAAGEVEWNDVSRGLDADQVQRHDSGLTSVPVSNEAPIRAYWERWRSLMAAPPVLTTA